MMNMAIFSKLKSALSKSSNKLSDGLSNIFVKRKLDDETLEELEELLIEADMGVHVATDIITELSKSKYNQEISEEEIREVLASYISNKLEPVAKPLEVQTEHTPHVILVVGVNGNGKTTTIGKLAHKWKNEGKSVMLAAADTFRAAASEQLKVWADRVEIPLMTGAVNSDPASLAYKAIEQARNERTDILMIDTAGRLQNQQNLMEELQKIVRVLKKQDETAPHTVLQVLDATTGQNALSQVELFKQAVDVTGLVLTKLDGSAKGGVAVALAKKFQIPVHFMGMGEQIDDLQPFDYKEFSSALCHK